jgi:hypothetical protein
MKDRDIIRDALRFQRDAYSARLNRKQSAAVRKDLLRQIGTLTAVLLRLDDDSGEPRHEDDFDHDATVEQSLDYFNRYVAGDR